jgi:hypothetical protein
MAVPLEEVPTVVTALDLLAEVHGLDRGIADDTGSFPPPDHPAERTQPFRQVLQRAAVELEHPGIVAWAP